MPTEADLALFTRATNEYLADLYAAQPVMATMMGVHEFDGELPCAEPFALAEDLRRERAYLHEIDRLSLAGMPLDYRIDYRLARAATQVRIVELEQARPMERQPARYVDTALYGAYLLVSREFAPIEERAAALLSRLIATPGYLRAARASLRRPPRLFVESGIAAGEGGVEFYAAAVSEFAAALRSDALRADIARAADAAAVAMRDFTAYLRQEMLPDAGDDFALGAELFAYVLRVGHMLDETPEELVAFGREELELALAEIETVVRSIDPRRHWTEIVAELKTQHPDAADLVAAYRTEMLRAREFVVVQGLVDLPSDESLRVVETPTFERPFLPYAAYVPPAAFEARQDGFFWVTPIPAGASGPERDALLQGHSRFNLPIIAIHEAYPGHHLQFSHANRHPSRVRRHFADSNLFVEGWALYCEEMMYEAGYYEDPRVRLMQLKGRLWRAARVIIDIKLHAGEMDFEAATAFLVENAALEPEHARAEIRRYAATPTQPLTYAVGKRQLLQLRDRSRTGRADRLDLREFHNELLGYGAVPPRLLAEAMFAAP